MRIEILIQFYYFFTGCCNSSQFEPLLLRVKKQKFRLSLPPSPVHIYFFFCRYPLQFVLFNDFSSLVSKAPLGIFILLFFSFVKTNSEWKESSGKKLVKLNRGVFLWKSGGGGGEVQKRWWGESSYDGCLPRRRHKWRGWSGPNVIFHEQQSTITWH